MRVALTFDTEPTPAGHSADVARRILDALSERGVIATFFVQGAWAEQHPDLAARLTADGHRVGNHTHSHVLPGKIPREELLAEIERAEQTIVRLTGQDPRPYFRCPRNSGAFDPAVLERIREAGYRQTGWTLDTLDWQEGRTAEELRAAVLQAVESNGDSAVLLLHSWPDVTAEALAGVLDDLIARGVEFVTLDGLEPASIPTATVAPRAASVQEHPLGESTMWGLGAKLITVAANFLLSVVIARALGPEGKGAHALVIQVVSVLVVVLGLGLNTANVYYVARRQVTPQSASANSVLLVLVTGAMAAVVSLVFISGPLAPDPPYSVAMAGAASALFVSTMLFSWLGAIAVGRAGLKPQAAAGIWSTVVVLLGAVLLWWTGVLTPLLAVLLGAAGQVVAIIAVVRLSGGGLLSLTPSRSALRQMLRYSAKSYVVDLVRYLHLRVDILLLGWMTDLATVGVYSVAVSLAEVARYVPNVMSSALFARASQVSHEEGLALCARVSRLTVAVVLASSVALGVLGPVILPAVFGARFAGAVAPFLVLVPGVALIAIAEVPSSYLFSREVIYWRSAAVLVAFNVIANLVLIPRLGAVGAAMASLVTYALFSAVIVGLMRRTSGLSLREILVPGADDVRVAVQVVRGLRRASGGG